MAKFKQTHEFWEATRRGAPMSRNRLWNALEALGILSLLLGILAAPFYTSLIDNPWYNGVTWCLVVCVILITAWAVGLMPYWGMREMKRDVDEELAGLSSLRQLRDRQRSELKANPNRWVDVTVKRITLSEESYADVEFYITNRSVYDLEFTWEFKETHVSIEEPARRELKKLPQMPKHLSRLAADSISDGVCIRQELDANLLSSLRNAVRAKVVLWGFHVVVSIKFDGDVGGEQGYYPTWEGIHDAIGKV